MADSEKEQSAADIGLRSILRPLVRYCLRHAIHVQALLEVAKELYVEAAREEIENTEANPSASKISLMTGVHRKDVARLLDEKPKRKKEKDIISRVIGQWQHDPRFQSKTGKPRALTCQGTGSEFSALVNSVSKELSAYPILFELERLGTAKRRGTKIYLKKQQYIHREDIAEGFRFLSEDSDDLLHAVEENLTADLSTPNLHIKTEFDKVPVEHLGELRKWLLFEGTKFHQKVRKYLSQFDVDMNPDLRPKSKKHLGRIAFGTFSRTVPSEAEEEEE